MVYEISVCLQEIVLDQTVIVVCFRGHSCLCLPLPSHPTTTHTRGSIFNICLECSFSISVDMIKRRNLRTRNIKILVLDEADEMLNKGRYANIHSFFYKSIFTLSLQDSRSRSTMSIGTSLRIAR